MLRWYGATPESDSYADSSRCLFVPAGPRLGRLGRQPRLTKREASIKVGRMVDDDGEHPRERYFELKLLRLLPHAGSAHEFAAWSRVLRYWSEWCESQAVARVLLNDEERGSWADAGRLLGKSKQAVHKRWSPALRPNPLRALTAGLMRERPPWADWAGNHPVWSNDDDPGQSPAVNP